MGNISPILNKWGRASSSYNVGNGSKGTGKAQKNKTKQWVKLIINKLFKGGHISAWEWNLFSKKTLSYVINYQIN